MSFPRYPEYKDSGVEWLGQVPKHWNLTPLKHAAAFASGGTPSKSTPEYWDGSVPWASSKDLKCEELADTIDHITTRAVADGVALVEPGDLMVVVRGMILAHTFPVTKALVPMAINQDLKAIRPSGDWHGDYFAGLLRASANETFRRLDEAGHGTKALRMEAWLGMTLPRPPIDEQETIARLLRRETAKIDALVAAQQRLIELLQEKRQAVISHAVTKGLNPDAPMKDSGIEWLGQIPDHWEVRSVRRLIEGIEQGRSPDCHSRPAEGDEWAVLRTGCVNGGVFNPQDNKALPDGLEPRPELQVLAGDVLMSRASGSPALVGSAAFVTSPPPRRMLSDKIFRIRLEPEVDREFFALFCNSPPFRYQVERSISGADGLANNLPQRALLSFLGTLPPMHEQRHIVGVVNRELAQLSALRQEASFAVELLQERRAALISAAVTGQIDVRGTRA